MPDTVHQNYTDKFCYKC